MTFINYASREINCKIVYYGPGLGGKTTNIQYIYDTTNSDSKGKLISLATETDRTLFFDFLPMELGTIRGFKTRFHLYTVPGQVFYDASRKLILKGVDGIVFVADSQDERMDANIESISNLKINLVENGFDISAIPYVLQLNKRDLPNITNIDEMVKELKVQDEPIFEAVAIKGIGVMETLKAVAKQVIMELKRAAVRPLPPFHSRKTARRAGRSAFPEHGRRSVDLGRRITSAPLRRRVLSGCGRTCRGARKMRMITGCRVQVAADAEKRLEFRGHHHGVDHVLVQTAGHVEIQPAAGMIAR